MEREGERDGESGRMFDLIFNKPLPSVSLDVSMVFQHLAEEIDF